MQKNAMRQMRWSRLCVLHGARDYRKWRSQIWTLQRQKFKRAPIAVSWAICSHSAWSFVRYLTMEGPWLCLKIRHRHTLNKLKWWVSCNCHWIFFSKSKFQLDDAFQNILPKIPIPLQEATTRLVSRQPGPRPTAQLLQLIKYFR